MFTDLPFMLKMFFILFNICTRRQLITQYNVKAGMNKSAYLNIRKQT